ncbi:MAG TPA: metallophosphoesterase family protein [Miltoncostaeaceae bacterium]|nr:metallophosphoesterase family protein [Miltoncostaeaceae bacterium]
MSDIHGNRQALDATLRAAREAGATTWWCLGDIVGYGADPTHCLAISKLATRCIGGNHDLGVTGEVSLDVFADLASDAIVWTRKALGEVGRAKLRALEPADPDGEVPLYHGSPRDPVWEYILSIEQAREALEHRRVPLTFVGHTHIPFAWTLTSDGAMRAVGVPPGGVLDVSEGRWLVNPGSVGQPRDHDARAAWALLDLDARTVTFRRTPYDVAGAQNAILRAGLPALLATRLSEGR